MAYSVNKAMVLGRLGQDPESRFTQGGSPVTTFSIATNRRWRDQRTEEMREATDWHNIVCFGRVAEIASEYLQKGSQCYVEGELRTNSWERDGVTHYKTEINVRDLVLLSGASQGRSQPGDTYRNDPPRGGRSSYDSGRQSARSSNRRDTNDMSEELGDVDLDDDIPF